MAMFSEEERFSGRFIGGEPTGSRFAAVQKLVAFMTDSRPGYRVVRGVYRVGKSRVIARAVEVTRTMASDHIFRVWPDPTYLEHRELSLSEFLNFIDDHSDQPKKLKSNIPNKDGRDLDEAARKLRKFLQREGIQEGQAVMFYYPTDLFRPPAEYIARIFYEELGEWNWKIMIEQRGDSGGVEIPDRKPELNREVGVYAFRSDEAEEFVKERVLSWALSCSVHHASGESNGSDIARSLVELCGRHPEILLWICKWIESALQRDESAASSAPLDVVTLRRFVLREIKGPHLNDLEVVLEGLLKTLPLMARKQFEEMVSLSGKRPNVDEGLVELKVNGLTSEEGELAEALRIAWLAIKNGEDNHVMPPPEDRENKRRIAARELIEKAKGLRFDIENDKTLRITAGITRVESALQEEASSSNGKMSVAIESLRGITGVLDKAIQKCLETINDES